MSDDTNPESVTLYDMYLAALTRFQVWGRALLINLAGHLTHAASPAGPSMPAADSVPTSQPSAKVGSRWLEIGFLGMSVAVLAVRFWQLGPLQNEVYGDISIIYEYVRNILRGHWPFYFDLSSGPLYHYLITPIIMVAGLNYAGIKLASVLTSLGLLIFTFLFARRLVGLGFALVTTFIAGISFWLLIFSRLGNSQIIVPFLVMLSLWLLLRYIQERRLSDLIACALVSTLGLYGYPQSFIIAPVIFLMLVALHLTGTRIERPAWIWFIAVCIVCGLPFIWILSNGLAVADGYLGSKLVTDDNVVLVLASNVIRALGAFNVAGDAVARSNPARLPHLDVLSGILFLIGLCYWLWPGRWQWSVFVILPFLLLQVPSMLVLEDSGEIPSASRTLGAAPLAYLLVATGLWQVAQFVAKRYGRRAAIAAGGGVLAIITAFNLITYFVVYIQNLPLNNLPVARIIVNYANLLPPTTNVYLVGCCWEAGMPEPKSIEYEMLYPDKFRVLDASTLTCTGLDATLNGPAVMIWTNKSHLPSPALSECADRFPAQLYTSPQGYPVFHAAPVVGLPARLPEINSGPSDTSSSPTATTLVWGGSLVTAQYSPLDIGRIEDAVDGNIDSLMRGKDVNPFIVTFEFAEPRATSELHLTIGTIANFSVRVILTYTGGSTQRIENTYQDLPNDPTVEIFFPSSAALLQSIHIEIMDMGPLPGDGYHIHVREIVLK